MRHAMLLALVFTMLTFSVSVFAQETKPNPFEKLETAIPAGIQLLEKKEYVKFLSNFVTPSELVKIQETMKLEDLAKMFGGVRGADMLKAFKEIEKEKPELSDDGKNATYKLKVPIGDKDQITFVKIKKLWHIKN